MTLIVTTESGCYSGNLK